MKRILVFLAAFLMACEVTLAQQIQGDWKGALNVGAMKLTIVIHLADGKCTMDSPDQNAKGIPAEVLYNENDSVAVEVKMLGAKYCARLIDGKLIGVFSQRGINIPLEMTNGELVRNRPQTPKPPFPYDTEELTFTNEKDGAVLAGTLVMPKNAKNPPLVVMVSGSGQQNRDEELFEHKPFAVIADRLARQGIASFRYDDRGVGGSNGLSPKLTTEDFRQDALCALRMLRAKGVSKRIGILGHSEGGLIAFMIAGDTPGDVDFVVSLAGTAVKGEQIIVSQMKTAAERSGQKISNEQIGANIAVAKLQPWYKFFVEYDPTEAINKIRCLVLALNGSKDIQVEADVNIPALKSAMKIKESDKFIVYEGLNHLFQHAKTGMPDEYGEIEETISEDVLADIIAWILCITNESSDGNVSIMFRNNQPQKDRKVNFETPKFDPYKEKFKNLNIADGVRQIIR